MGVTEYFMQDHQEVDQILMGFEASVAEGRPDLALLRRFQERLHRHMYWEEEILFPAVEDRGLHGPIQVMLAEHAEICGHIEAVQENLQRPQVEDALQRSLRRLKEVLRAHDDKEEAILYPAADQILREQASSLLDQVSRAGPPEGWVCRIRRS